MKRFDSPTEHFGAAREFRDVDDRETRVSQWSRGATGGDHLDAEFRESTTESDEVGLVRDR